MKKMMFLAVLCTLLGLQNSYAGNITIVNNSPTASFQGYLMADNNVAAPSEATTYGLYVNVPPSTTVSFSSPAALPNPNGFGLPALPTGAFIGIKATINFAGVYSVGKSGVYLGYPLSVFAFNTVLWTQIGDDVLINVL